MTNKQKKALNKLYKVKAEYHEKMACHQLDVYEQIDYILYINDLEEEAYNDDIPYWEARAEYADGTVIDEDFEYNEEGDRNREEKRRQELEAYLMDKHDGCIWYSVDYCEGE